MPLPERIDVVFCDVGCPLSSDDRETIAHQATHPTTAATTAEGSTHDHA